MRYSNKNRLDGARVQTDSCQREIFLTNYIANEIICVVSRPTKNCAYTSCHWQPSIGASNSLLVTYGANQKIYVIDW